MLDTYQRRRKFYNQPKNEIYNQENYFLEEKIHRKKKKRNVRKKLGELVLYNRPSSEVEVMLDEDALRVWNLLIVENRHEENDEHKRRY